MPNELMLMKNVWVPADKPFTFKEQVDPRTGEQKYILRGLILPFNKISRNNVLYNPASVKEKHKSLIGRPVMYNHKIEGNEMPKGHFVDSYIIDTPDDKHPVAGWYYEADIDPEEKDMIRKLERGDLRHVSIQLVGGKVVERMAESGPYSEAYVQDIIEGSLVPAPGFLDTTAEFAEAFKAKRLKENLSKEELKELAGLISMQEQSDTMSTSDSKRRLELEKKASDADIEKACKIAGVNCDDVYGERFKKEAVDDIYDSPRYDGDCMICPWDGEEAESEDELADGYIEKLGEEAVKELIEKYG